MRQASSPTRPSPCRSAGLECVATARIWRSSPWASGVHRSLAAAERLAATHHLETTVIDLRTVTPLDVVTIRRAAARTRRVLVVDEDFIAFGLSGEIAAVIAEAEPGVRFARVATEQTVP